MHVYHEFDEELVGEYFLDVADLFSLYFFTVIHFILDGSKASPRFENEVFVQGIALDNIDIAIFLFHCEDVIDLQFDCLL